MAAKRLNIKIYGRVQGVNFRWRAEEKAKEFGIVGWIRNTGDGGVECVVEGAKEDLDKFLEWCQSGPRFARISDIQIGWEEPTGEFNNFQIRY